MVQTVLLESRYLAFVKTSLAGVLKNMLLLGTRAGIHPTAHSSPLVTEVSSQHKEEQTLAVVTIAKPK